MSWKCVKNFTNVVLLVLCSRTVRQESLSPLYNSEGWQMSITQCARCDALLVSCRAGVHGDPHDFKSVPNE